MPIGSSTTNEQSTLSYIQPATLLRASSANKRGSAVKLNSYDNTEPLTRNFTEVETAFNWDTSATSCRPLGSGFLDTISNRPYHLGLQLQDGSCRGS